MGSIYKDTRALLTGRHAEPASWKFGDRSSEILTGLAIIYLACMIVYITLKQQSEQLTGHNRRLLPSQLDLEHIQSFLLVFTRV